MWPRIKKKVVNRNRPWMTSMLELADKDFIIDIFKNLIEKDSHTE